MSYEVKGTVHAVLPKESGVGKSSGQPWSRQTVVIKWDRSGDQYQKTEYLALTNSRRAEEFGRLRVGDIITAKFDVTSREYNGKWYHDVNCFNWTLEASSDQQESQESQVESTPAQPSPQEGQDVTPASDDLPFINRPE